VVTGLLGTPRDASSRGEPLLAVPVETRQEPRHYPFTVDSMIVFLPPTRRLLPIRPDSSRRIPSLAQSIVQAVDNWHSPTVAAGAAHASRTTVVSQTCKPARSRSTRRDGPSLAWSWRCRSARDAFSPHSCTLAEPIVDQSELARSRAARTPPASVLAADDDVLHAKHIHCILQDRKTVQVGVHDDIGDVAMHK